MEFKRQCPKCNKEIYYKRKGDLGQGIKYNTMCKQCVADGRVYYKEKIYTKLCPGCGINIWYTELKRLRLSINNNIKCGSCSSPFKGKQNKKLKDTLNVINSVNVIYKNCKICNQQIRTTLWDKSRKYCSKTCYFNDSDIKNSKYIPKFNKNACLYFEQLNIQLNWKGVHGLNEGEKKIRKYWVDYYEPNLNIVIEWDEEFHLNQSEEDMIRCLEIIKHTNCDFYRINQKTLEIVKINKDGIIEKKEKNYWFRS